jgi:UDP-glucose 4-epimerase
VKALITGGAGFIGSHLSTILLDRDHEVICVDDLSKGPASNLDHVRDRPGFEFVQMDIRDLERLVEVGRDVDVVVHLAAAKIARYSSAYDNLTINLEGARCALELARRAEAKLVLASTSDVYGKNPELPFAETDNLVIGPSTSRRWAYAVTKLCDEHMAYAYADEFGVPVVLLRFFGAYGERQYLNWWGGPQGVFLTAIDKGEPVQIHGDGSQTRCFVYVSDLAEGIARAVERPQADGEILNIGTDEEVSILELARLIHAASGVGGDLNAEFIGYENFTKDYEDVQRRVPDLTKMRRVLELDEMVGLDEGIARLWSWYRAR